MRRSADFLLLALQWVLLIWGLFTALTTLHLYFIESSYFAAIPPAMSGADYFTPPTMHRLVVGLCTSFATMGIGGNLFFLRRLYLAR